MPLMASRGVATMTDQPVEQQPVEPAEQTTEGAEVVEPEFSEDREQEMRELDEQTSLVPDEGGGEE